LPWAFNRKEAKDHGEGGWLVGAPLTGKVLVIDDVITAGTAIREVAALFAKTEASMAAVLVALDRQEKGQGALSAIQEVEQVLGVPVRSIVGLSDIIQYLGEQPSQEQQLARMQDYRRQYGV
jgi:orotate phosphoribosyltransferase